MSKKKLITYFDFVRKLDEKTLKTLNIIVDTDLSNLINNKISVEKYVDMKYFQHIKE